MDLWASMLVVSLILPVSMIAFGFYCAKGGPDRINYWFGYRTPMAMINLDTWKFAHIYIGKLLRITWFVLLPVTAAVMLYVRSEPDDFISTFSLAVLGVQVGVVIVHIVFTELALRRKFDYNGKPKS